MHWLITPLAIKLDRWELIQGVMIDEMDISDDSKLPHRPAKLFLQSTVAIATSV